MATADEFRAAAFTLAVANDRLATLLSNLGDAPLALDGPTERATRSAFDVAHANVRTILAELGDQIVEARRRAAVCDSYSASVRRYMRSDDPDRRWPVRPAPWVTYG